MSKKKHIDSTDIWGLTSENQEDAADLLYELEKGEKKVGDIFDLAPKKAKHAPINEGTGMSDSLEEVAYQRMMHSMGIETEKDEDGGEDKVDTLLNDVLVKNKENKHNNGDTLSMEVNVVSKPTLKDMGSSNVIIEPASNNDTEDDNDEDTDDSVAEDEVDEESSLLDDMLDDADRATIDLMTVDFDYDADFDIVSISDHVISRSVPVADLKISPIVDVMDESDLTDKLDVAREFLLLNCFPFAMIDEVEFVKATQNVTSYDNYTYRFFKVMTESGNYVMCYMLDLASDESICLHLENICKNLGYNDEVVGSMKYTLSTYVTLALKSIKSDLSFKPYDDVHRNKMIKLTTDNTQPSSLFLSIFLRDKDTVVDENNDKYSINIPSYDDVVNVAHSLLTLISDDVKSSLPDTEDDDDENTDDDSAVEDEVDDTAEEDDIPEMDGDDVDLDDDASEEDPKDNIVITHPTGSPNIIAPVSRRSNGSMVVDVVRK